MECTQKLLNLTAIEYFKGMNIVHVHCIKQINISTLSHPRLLGKLLVANVEVLENRTHRLFYVIPRFGFVMELNGVVSFEVFFEWFLHRDVNNVYAVIANHETTDLKKVVMMYVDQMPKVDENAVKCFKQTIATPFSHRPMEPELESPDGQAVNAKRKPSMESMPVAVVPVLSDSSPKTTE